MDTKAKPIANPSVILREEFDDCAVLFDPDTAEAYALNPIDVFCWKRLDGKHTLPEIIAELRGACEDVPVEAEQNIEAFSTELAAKGLIGYPGSQLCLACGICCQGVLFYQDNNPKNYTIELGQYTPDDRNPLLPLTCLLFRDGRCIIHEDPKRPPCCRDCQCLLLKRLLQNEISLEESKRIIEGIRTLINKIINQLPQTDRSKPLIYLISDTRNSIQQELSFGNQSNIDFFFDLVSFQRLLNQYIFPIEGV